MQQSNHLYFLTRHKPMSNLEFRTGRVVTPRGHMVRGHKGEDVVTRWPNGDQHCQHFVFAWPGEFFWAHLASV